MRYHLSSKCAVLPFFLNKDQALRKTPLYTAVIMKGTPRPTRCFQWGNAQLFMAWQRAFACWNPAVGPGSSQRRLRKVNPRRAALVWMGKAALTLFQRSNCIKSAFCKSFFVSHLDSLGKGMYYNSVILQCYVEGGMEEKMSATLESIQRAAMQEFLEALSQQMVDF